VQAMDEIKNRNQEFALQMTSKKLYELEIARA